MAETKRTTMVIKTDLECQKCRKKIKKMLCKMPEIHDQKYDEKANTVTITVGCCCPEKIKKRIFCKGGESIKSIEIIKVPHPAIDEKNSSKGKQTVKSTDQSPKPNPHDAVPVCPPLRRTCCREYYGGPCFCRYPPYYGIPCPCYWGYYGTPVYDSWRSGGSYVYCGCRRGCCVGPCDCFNEDYNSSCSIM